MDQLVLKSFLPEIFFSVAILIQFFYNTRITNTANETSECKKEEDISKYEIYIANGVCTRAFAYELAAFFRRYREDVRVREKERLNRRTGLLYTIIFYSEGSLESFFHRNKWPTIFRILTRIISIPYFWFRKILVVLEFIYSEMLFRGLIKLERRLDCKLSRRTLEQYLEMEEKDFKKEAKAHNSFNFPLIERELFLQTVFILAILALFFSDLKLEGYLSSYSLVSAYGITLVKLCLTVVSLFSVLVVQQAFKFEKINFPELHTILLLSILGLFVMVSTYDFIVFYLAMEIQALCFYVLASSKRDSIFSIESGITYFINGSFMSGFYLLGVSLIYGTTGTLNLFDLRIALHSNLPSGYGDMLYLVLVGAIVLIISALLFKIACAPFHAWSIDVYEGAPLYATVIFSVVPKIPLYFFILKFLNCFNCKHDPLWWKPLDPIEILYRSKPIVFPLADIPFESMCMWLFAVCGMLSICIGTFSAISQKRIKRLFVYSSVAQTGYIVLAMSVFSIDGNTSALFFLLIYIITSLLIWSNIITIYGFSDKLRSFYNKQMDSLYLSTLSNFFKFNPLWASSFMIVLFSISAIPPLTGFLSKMLVFLSVVHQGHFYNILLAAFLLIVGSVSVYYYIRLIKAIFFEPRDPYVAQEFKTNFDYSELNLLTLINVVSISILLIAFYDPTLLWIIAHKISLSI